MGLDSYAVSQEYLTLLPPEAARLGPPTFGTRREVAISPLPGPLATQLDLCNRS